MVALEYNQPIVEEVKTDSIPKITFSSRFLRDNPQIEKNVFEEALMHNAWSIPNLESQIYIPGMGTTAHKAMPTSFQLSGQKFSIFAKHHQNLPLLSREFSYTEIAFARGLVTPQMIAMIENEEDGLLIGKLDHSAEPLSARRLDFVLTDPRVYNPRDLLTDFIGAIAKMHNLGIAHRDLHLGNLGYRFRAEGAPEVIFFDLETAEVLKGQDLIAKKADYIASTNQFDRIAQFEKETAQDLGVFAAYLAYYGFPMKRGRLLKEMIEIYRQSREETWGVLGRKKLSNSVAFWHEKTLVGLNQEQKFPVKVSRRFAIAE